MKESINNELVGIWLARLVDCEHGSKIDLFEPAPTTHLVTQVGYNVMLLCTVLKRINSTNPLIYEQIIKRKKLILYFPLQDK